MLSGAGVIICAALWIGINSFILQLPDISGNKSITEPIREQITWARYKTYLMPTSDNIGNLGMIFHSNAIYNEAVLCYKSAIRKDKENIKWKYYLGCLDLENGDNKDALDNFKDVISRDPGNYMAVYYSGESCQRLNNNPEAEKYFTKVLAFDDQTINFGKPKSENNYPLKIYARFNLARIYLESNRLPEAEKILKEIINERINFGPAFRLLGNVYTKKGDLIAGQKFNTRAKDYQDYTPPADPMIDDLLLMSRSELNLLKGIDIAVKNGNFPWAFKLCDHSLKYLPDNKFLLSKAIKVFMTTDNEKRVYKLVQKHLKYFEKDFRELIEMADFFLLKGQAKMGLVYFSAAKKVEPMNPILPVWLFKWKYNSGAQKLMREQLASDPENAKFLANAVNISMGNNSKDTAIIYLGKLGKLFPSDPDYKRFSGYLAYQDKNYSEAIANWKEVLKVDPKDIGLISNLNKVFWQKQMWNDSFVLLHQALEDNPNDPMLLEELGKLLILCPEEKIRDISQGCEYSERAFYSYYFSPEVHLSASKNLATAYAMLGNKKMAFQFMNGTLDLSKDSNIKELTAWADDLMKKYNLSASKDL